MIYVISDIEGRLRQMTAILQTVRFSDRDVLYVIGNLVGDGEDPVGVLVDLSVRANVYPVAGAKDFRTLKMLAAFEKLKKSGSTPDAALVSEMADWAENENGTAILNAFRALDDDMREGILDYLSDMTLCEEAEVKGKRYLLVHAGICDFRDDRDPLEYSPEEVFADEYPDTYDTDATVITGAEETASGTVERKGNRIRMCCGDRIACLCLDNGKEYYA